LCHLVAHYPMTESFEAMKQHVFISCNLPCNLHNSMPLQNRNCHRCEELRMVEGIVGNIPSSGTTQPERPRGRSSIMSMQHKLLAGAGALAIALALSSTAASARGGGGFAGAGTGARGVSTMGSSGMRGTPITGSMIPSHATLTQSHPSAAPGNPSPANASPNVTFQQRTLDPPPGGVDSATSAPVSHPLGPQPTAPSGSPQTQPNAPTTHPMGLDGTESGDTSLATHPQLTHPAAPDMLHRTLDPPGGN
jgi:hypothetical protein